MTITIKHIESAEPSLIGGLSRLLQDAVHGGASVGFLAPLSDAEASEYWTEVLAGLGPGLRLWVAECEGQIVGSVQLAPCTKANGRHRAEVQKLLVLSSHRGQGISRRLLSAVESYACADGRTLLVLDTLVGSAAESVYRHLGWFRAGEVPDYAASPDGVLHATVIFYKKLEA